MQVINLNTIITEQLATPEYDQFLRYHPDIRIETFLNDKLFNNKGSAPHLAKTFMNLLNNAAEAMPAGGAISIKTDNISLLTPLYGYEQIEPGEYSVLSITDCGVGISQEEQVKIFEPFFTKKKMGRSGSGLGMSVVWGTLKDHGGYIDISSKVDRGTVFTLYFPITHEDLSVPQSNFDIAKYKGNQEDILIVDDTDSQREIAQSILEKLNYRVACASSGEDAVAYLRDNHADLILLDMIMEPGIDGLETYEQINVIKPSQKVVIVSGFSESERVKELQILSKGRYIKKPYDLEDLGKAVHLGLNDS